MIDIIRTDMRTNNRAKAKKVIMQISFYLILALVVLILFVPFYIMLTTSFKTLGETYREFTWWPKEFSVEAYSSVLTTGALQISVPRSFLNTLMIVLPTTAVGLFMSALSAYAFAKYDFRGSGALFSILLFSMMMPGAITLIPQFMIFSELNWVGTPLPLIIPGLFGNATAVFFLRQYIRGLPTDLIEAARVEGMNRFRIFLSLILPLSVPALIAQGILMFIGGYNDYLSPLIYLQDFRQYTLQVMLSQYVGMSDTSMGPHYPKIMAASMLTLLPLLIVYSFTQKFFISGIAVSGMKS